MMRINITSVFVTDQDKALRFYTEVLGFIKKTDIPLGEFRWLTLVSPEESENIELLLEPLAFPPAMVYQKSLFEAGIPLISFAADDIKNEFERMKKLGVRFTMESTKIGPVTVATFDDTCGNLIQIAEKEENS